MNNIETPMSNDDHALMWVTYPSLNDEIVKLLRMSDNPTQLYAAQRIEELETQLSAAKTLSAQRRDKIVKLQHRLGLALKAIRSYRQQIAAMRRGR